MMHRLIKLLPIAALAVLLAAGLVVAGCGDSDEATTTTAAATPTTVASTGTTAAAPETTTPATEPATATTGEPAKKVVLRLPMGPPDGDPLVTPAQAMADRFNARTNGTYEIQCYPGGSLVAPPEQLDACRTGATEMTFTVLGMYAGLDPRMAIVELPFIFNNTEALQAAHNDEMVALYDSMVSAQFNQKVLGLTHIGFVEIIGTKPVKTLDDWDGLLVGVNSAAHVDAFQALGAQTVIIDWTESYSNLDKGVVDTVQGATTYMWIAELYNVGKYSTWMAGLAGNYGMHVNLDVWNAMPPDIQQILQEEVTTACVELNQVHTDILKPNYDKLVENGCEVFIAEGAERDAWKAACAPIVEARMAEFGEFGTKFMSLVDAANAAHP